MSDPYGHGETCDCRECMAWSEGYEAGQADRGTAVLPPLRTTTAWLRQRHPALMHVLPPSGVAYVIGWLHGRYRGSPLHPNALETLLVAKAERGTAKPKDVAEYLRAHCGALAGRKVM